MEREVDAPQRYPSLQTVRAVADLMAACHSHQIWTEKQRLQVRLALDAAAARLMPTETHVPISTTQASHASDQYLRTAVS
jgi:hypothetical protein